MSQDRPYSTATESRFSSADLLVAAEVVALVAIGGFAGSNLRYFAGLVVPGLAGTLLVNVLGSTTLGFVLYERIYGGVLADETRLLVGTGFLSSLTTYSSFAVQTAQAAPALMVANVVANYALGFVGVLVGRSLARRFDGGER
ncbi:MAG: CrcB family protein [Halanaeroarchaeum sp.]